jgi:hypothetical protein
VGIAALGEGEQSRASCHGAGDGVIQMTPPAKLLSQKQELIERLQQGDIGPAERDEIGRLLEHINAALDSLDEAGPGRQ